MRRASIYAFFGLICILSLVTVFNSCSWVNEAQSVTKDEFGPRAMLKKYEWFKDAAATIEEKRHTINVYQANVDNMLADYEDIPRTDWDRLDKQQYNQWRLEITGIKASYNKVVKEYNAQSSKFNWEFFDTVEIPKSYDLYLDI